MTCHDVFNGDADGLCALQQLRLAHPCDSVRVTGPKREIDLVARVDAKPGDRVSVLDVSLDVNRDALVALLERGVDVEYFDHHHAGVVPAHPRLVAHIDTSPAVCTGIIVDRVLRGAHRRWAIVAAFGDNLRAPAESLAASIALDAATAAELRELGEDLAYNGYGDTLGDLIVDPAALYQRIAPYRDPMDFLAADDTWKVIRATRLDDLDRAGSLPVEALTPRAALVRLPDEAWARRIRGALGNRLAFESRDRAHALVSPDPGGTLTVSVRAPVDRPHGADALCRSFEGGGGRAGAAGVNRMHPSELERFVAAFARAYG